MERVICNRLFWKLEVDGLIADTQFAYRKQKSCVHTMLRVCNSISEARCRKEYTVIPIMDYECCYERIWRACLLKKLSDKGINGKMWIYIKKSCLIGSIIFRSMTASLLHTYQLLVYHRGQQLALCSAKYTQGMLWRE